MRTALVTGGAGAVGTAVTTALLEAGWRVVVPHRAPVAAGVLPAHDRLALVQADLFDPAAVAEATAQATRDPDAPLRAVANLAGGFAAGQPVATTPVETFEAQLRLNLRPTYLVTQAALPHLVAAGGGSIVCVSSRSATRPFAGAAGYSAGKAGVIAFAQAVAAEHRDDGVRCNVIVPSVIDTPTNRAAMAPGAGMVAPADIARVVSFLLDDASAAINGAAVPVYGRT